MKTSSALLVANTILWHSDDEYEPITHRRLQYLVYLAHLHYIQETGKKMFPDLWFEALLFGPVSRDVYIAFHDDGSWPVRHYGENFDGSVYVLHEINQPIERKVIHDVWRLYGRASMLRLWWLTCKPMSAWFKARLRNHAQLDDCDIALDCLGRLGI